MGLVLERKVGQRILIGADICVEVVRIERGAVALNIEAPRSLRVDREEVQERRQAELERKAAALEVRQVPAEELIPDGAIQTTPEGLFVRQEGTWVKL